MEFLVEEKYVTEFHEKGYTVIPNFLSPDEVRSLKEATKKVVEKYCKVEQISTFSGKEDVKVSRDTYFAESGDKIRGFYEEDAVDQDGKLVTSDTFGALNKVGHALHRFEPVFYALTLGPKVKRVVKSVTEMKEPTVIQSMVIFKNKKIGGFVKPHQDSSYMYSEPVPGSLLGFWIALDDATLENGCLHFLPGSHKDGKLHERFIRNPDKTSDQLFIYEGSKVPPVPDDQLEAAPCKSGDLVLIDGLVIHQSEPNTSEQSRMAYTFHVLDSGAEYSPDNWLQPTAESTFMRFSETEFE